MTLSEILDRFSKADELPGGWWAFDDDHTELGLEHHTKDGSTFCLDLNQNGTITVYWHQTGDAKGTVLRFIADTVGGK